jgi:hypothetical protein
MSSTNSENPTPEEEEKITVTSSSFKWIIILGFFVFLFVLLFKNPKALFGKYIWKKKFTDVYGVDKKTINKWVKYFGQESFPDYEKYLKRRKLSYFEYFGLIENFGSIDDYPVLSKKEIVEQCDGTYKSLRESIQQYPDKFGISPEAFSDLRKFPPKIGQQIVKQYS